MACHSGEGAQLTTLAEAIGTAAISLEVGCDGSPLCGEFAGQLYLQLSHGYEMCSVTPVPESLELWRSCHRTARKRADRCERLGYRFEHIHRHMHTDGVFSVNTSMTERQGRRMTASYWERPSSEPLPHYACSRHCIRTYGVLKGDSLVAYLWLYRSGDLALVSSILGHADHLDNGVMYLLFQGAVEHEAGCEGSFVYNRHDSGGDGLRFYKERVGLLPTRVEWLP